MPVRSEMGGLVADIGSPAVRHGSEPNRSEVSPTTIDDVLARRGPRMFVVHAPADAWFVNGFLLEALGLPEREVLVSSQLDPGAVVVHEIERGALSPLTVVVVTPAFLVCRWAQFANQLAMHQSIEAASDGSATLVPAILTDCELPLLSKFLVPLDFRNQERGHWEAEAARLRRRISAPAPTKATVPCPYPGMQPFTPEGAARFHGRDKEISDLLGWLRNGQRELYVIGPSGSGKSSLVAAGLIPSLRRSPELAGSTFLVRRIRPGADPTSALADALGAIATERGDGATRWLPDAVDRLLAAHADHEHLLLFIDQLEELFTTSEVPARAAFIDVIRELRSDSRVALVLTLRADFYASLMESPLWADLGGQLSRLDVSPLRGDALRRAIEAPAQACGVYFEPVLVERLLHEVADEPGALPLLQDTLLDLWHRRARGSLRLAEYATMSDGEQTGLAVTVARRANGALADLSPARRDIARRVLLRLIQFGDGTTTRRQQARGDLSTTTDVPEDIDAVIRHLADRRLITTGGGDDSDPSARIDLAHEVLLSAWQTLAAWIRSRKDDEQRRRVLEAKAAEWVAHGRGRSRLLDTDELREARHWLTDEKARDLGVSDELQNLLARSETVLAAEAAARVAEAAARAAEAEARRRARVRWVTLAFVGLIGAVIAVSMLASNRASEARRQLIRNHVSQAHALLMDEQPARAAPYLLAARQAAGEDVSIRTLFQWAAAGTPRLRFVHKYTVTTAAWSPDGKRIATASWDGTARIWDAVSGQALTPPLAHTGAVIAVAWSPDGKRVVTASRDGTARIWDALDGKAMTRPLAHLMTVLAVAWSPDGTHVATASRDATARVWDAVSGQPVTPPLNHPSWVVAVTWSPDGKQIATASRDGSARVWEAEGRLMMSLAHKGPVIAVAWSADGTRIATGSEDKTVRLWSAVDGKPVLPPLEHDGPTLVVAWSPDGTRLATSADTTARVWNAVSGEPVTPPLTHRRLIHDVAWSPDGKRLATASWDATARVWDAIDGQPVTPPLVHRRLVHAVAWRPDGKQVATASEGGVAQLWDVTSRQAATPLQERTGVVTAVAWSPDRTRLAMATNDKTARIWDATSGQPVTARLVHDGVVHAMAWSPDGKRIATGSEDKTARVWDAGTGDLVTTHAHEGPVRAVAWSPEGARVATAPHGDNLEVWDATTGKAVRQALKQAFDDPVIAWSPDGTRIATVTGYANVDTGVWDSATGQAMLLTLGAGNTAVAWSPDGTRIATASHDRFARVWDATTGTPVTPPLAHQGAVLVVAWSPDGTRIATASADNSARIWDATSGRPVTPPLTHRARALAVVWSPNGTRVATASDDGTVRVWDPVDGLALTPPLASSHLGVTARPETPEDPGRIWDTVSGLEIKWPGGQRARGVQTLVWSPDSTRAMAASVDGTVHVWDVPFDTGTLDNWRAVVEHGDYSLNEDGVLVSRESPARALGAPE